MAAGFKDVVEADEVGLYVHIGVIDRVAHTGLSRKVDDDIGLILGKDAVNDGLISHVAADEGKAAAGAFTLLREGTELFKAVLLEGDLVIIVHAVDADNMGAFALQQRLAQKAADEPGSASDKDGFIYKQRAAEYNFGKINFGVTNMKKHLFLTGPSGIGKTTIIRKALGTAAGYAGGFITERVTDGDGRVEGFDLYPAAAAIGHDGFDGQRFLDLGTVPPQKDNEVFRESAAQMLREAEYYPFVMLDEIGGFEMLIPQFRNELAQLLNSDAPIIGVIKGAENAEELRASFGLGEKFTMLTDNLRAVLANDEDTVVIEVKQRGDETAKRIVEAWVKEYADIR